MDDNRTDTRRSAAAELRAEYDRMAERAHTGERTLALVMQLRELAGRLEQCEGHSPDHARALLDRAREARATAERIERDPKTQPPKCDECGAWYYHASGCEKNTDPLGRVTY